MISKYSSHTPQSLNLLPKPTSNTNDDQAESDTMHHFFDSERRRLQDQLESQEGTLLQLRGIIKKWLEQYEVLNLKLTQTEATLAKVKEEHQQEVAKMNAQNDDRSAQL